MPVCYSAPPKSPKSPDRRQLIFRPALIGQAAASEAQDTTPISRVNPRSPSPPHSPREPRLAGPSCRRFPSAALVQRVRLPPPRRGRLLRLAWGSCFFDITIAAAARGPTACPRTRRSPSRGGIGGMPCSTDARLHLEGPSGPAGDWPPLVCCYRRHAIGRRHQQADTPSSDPRSDPPGQACQPGRTILRGLF